ncbi:MAG: serine O-acetyltransferase [Rhodospirillales bacterium]|nr:serine O-acetyltransferase [Rhodospirillales bacterium]MCW8863198.1 serine O-acetyltransferase [Rhodospirillales bacterium]MCW8952477.1 serine O-acetyltransferase [Rhodospirillales bacterium]MCW9001908.1 serine O-acetyltransferase [Rhodospirillales bacterium]
MVFKRLKEDIDSFIVRDPAARSRLEVLLCYPGLHAILFYRLAHGAWKREWYLLGRFLSHFAKVFTAIEIHPGATIGRRLFIDHGTGVVIGETAEIGNDVTLYQGVTLGGTTIDKGKRHPTLEDGVIVGSGAQVLGPLTLGEGSRIGANAVVLSDVPKGVTVVGIPARMLMRRKNKGDDEFCAYGTPSGDVPDPVARSIDSLRRQVSLLMARVEELEETKTKTAPKEVNLLEATDGGADEVEEKAEAVAGKP